MKRKILMGVGLYLGAGAIVGVVQAARGRLFVPGAQIASKAIGSMMVLTLWPVTLFNELRGAGTIAHSTASPGQSPVGVMITPTSRAELPSHDSSLPNAQANFR